MKKVIYLSKTCIFVLIISLCFTLCGCKNDGVESLNPDTGIAVTPINDAPVISEGLLIDDSDRINQPVITNPYPSLNVPTQITKLDGLYFIVDCYNNQVIYNDNTDEPLNCWKVMTDDINRGHTIASNGNVYLIDDTENHRILVMKKTTNANGEVTFVRTQEFTEIGTRPHYIIYYPETDTFYVLSSMTGELYLFRYSPDKDMVFLSEKKSFPELNGYYVRSFSIIDNKLYLVSGDAAITVANLQTFEVEQKYPVPNELVGMIQISRIEDYFYITNSTDGYGSQDAATIIRVKNLEDLITSEYEDVYSNFIGGGTPYFISEIDGHYYLCEHRLPGHSIWKFDVKDNEIKEVVTIY